MVCPVDNAWVEEMYGVKNQKMSRGEFYESMQNRLDWQIVGDLLDGWKLERFKDESYIHYLAGRDDSYSVAGYLFDRFGGWVKDVEANNPKSSRVFRFVGKAAGDALDYVLPTKETFLRVVGYMAPESDYALADATAAKISKNVDDYIEKNVANKMTQNQAHGMSAIGDAANIVGARTGIKLIAKHLQLNSLGKAVSVEVLEKLNSLKTPTRGETLANYFKLTDAPEIGWKESLGKIYSLEKNSKFVKPIVTPVGDKVAKSVQFNTAKMTSVVDDFAPKVLPDAAKVWYKNTINELDHFMFKMKHKGLYGVDALEGGPIGTHVMSRHVGKDLGDYVKRFAERQSSGRRLPPTMSGFVDEVTADYVVTRVMVDKVDDIGNWLKIGNPQVKAFSLDFNFKIGEGILKVDYLNNANKINNFNKAKVVLSKHPKGRFELDGQKFDIITSYPIL